MAKTDPNETPLFTTFVETEPLSLLKIVTPFIKKDCFIKFFIYDVYTLFPFMTVLNVSLLK